jgi:hypothetical protein
MLPGKSSLDGNQTKESSNEAKNVVTSREGAAEIFSASLQQNLNFLPQYNFLMVTPAASDRQTISPLAPMAQPTISVAPSDVNRTRSGIVIRLATRLIKVLAATLTNNGESLEDFLLNEQHALLLFAFAASANPDSSTMHLHEVMRQISLSKQQ